MAMEAIDHMSTLSARTHMPAANCAPPVYATEAAPEQPTPEAAQIDSNIKALSLSNPKVAAVDAVTLLHSATIHM